jgi:hypothetical protein
MADNQISKTKTGTAMTVRQDLSGEEITLGREMSPTAAAAAARAEIEARCAIAFRNRRDEDQGREDMLRMCRRPGFAETAKYTKPVGNKRNAEGRWEKVVVEDLSIRAIEGFIQAWGNMFVNSRITFEDSERALLTVQVLDLQRNVGYSTDATIEKLVERKEVKQGRTVRGRRENSYGEIVYLVEATHDEFRNLLGAERSKLIRDNGKRLLPRDILDEARALVDKTLSDANAKDPDAAKKKVLDRFAVLGISASLLKEYLGRPLETLTLKDLEELGTLHNGLKEGDFTWTDVMRVKREAAEGEASKAEVPRKLRDRLMPQTQADTDEGKQSGEPHQQTLEGTES